MTFTLNEEFERAFYLIQTEYANSPEAVTYNEGYNISLKNVRYAGIDFEDFWLFYRGKQLHSVNFRNSSNDLATTEECFNKIAAKLQEEFSRGPDSEEYNGITYKTRGATVTVEKTSFPPNFWYCDLKFERK